MLEKKLESVDRLEQEMFDLNLILIFIYSRISLHTDPFLAEWNHTKNQYPFFVEQFTLTIFFPRYYILSTEFIFLWSRKALYFLVSFAHTYPHTHNKRHGQNLTNSNKE